ncbi:MAG: hypothetical protein ACI4XQ_08790, partial [Eubacteriales bacterium]
TVLSAVVAGLAPFCAYILMGVLSNSFSASTVIGAAGVFPLLGCGLMTSFILISGKKKTAAKNI